MGSGASCSADALKASVAESDPAKLVEQFKALDAAGQEKWATVLSEALGKKKAVNSAFIFIKPHAVTEKVKALAKSGLEAKGIKILAEGSLTGEVIDEKKLIDNHYYAIASKATILKPDQLNVPADKFEKCFKTTFAEELKAGKCFNAMDGCKLLGIDADQLGDLWAKAKDKEKLVKLGGGFYCALIEVEGKDPIYIFNGFFMQMRSKFTKPGTQIYYYSVEWDPKDLSWNDFRGKVLGPTDPKEAPAGSLRGEIMAKWQDLGLVSEPNVGDNGMHASASPFEGLAEKNNWLGEPIASNSFGALLMAGGMKGEMIKEWTVDPQVNIEADKKGSIFDALEDMDVDDCCAKLMALSKLN
jgi:nucleoside diphosphate kinase